MGVVMDNETTPMSTPQPNGMHHMMTPLQSTGCVVADNFLGKVCAHHRPHLCLTFELAVPLSYSKHKLRFLHDVASKVVFHWHYGPDDMLFQTQVSR